MSSRRHKGSGKPSRLRQHGMGRRGEIGSAARSRAWSIRSPTIAPKRAMSGVRGQVRRSPIRPRPTRTSPSTMFGGSRNAADGRSASVRRVSPFAIICVLPLWNRAIAHAAPGLSAKPIRASKPSLLRRERISSASAASPSNKCAQPVMSSHSPSRPSTAAQGVYRLHQSASAANAFASSTGSASTTRSCGTSARASASRRPGTMPLF